MEMAGGGLVAAIIGRRSIRSFRDEPLPAEVVRQILRAGLAAPSAGGCLSSRFFVVEHFKSRQVVVKATYYQDFLGTAPLVVVVASTLEALLAKYHQDLHWATRFALQDAAATAQNALLAAWAMGVGGTWVGGIRQDLLSRGLGLPTAWVPQIVLAFGYPLGEVRARSASEVVAQGRIRFESDAVGE